jgi:hypothetical protein
MAKGCHAVPGVIFRCHNEMFCPGGPAGSCAEGRDVGSVACFHCERGKKELNLGRSERQDQWIVCISMNLVPVIICSGNLRVSGNYCKQLLD